MHLYRGAPVVRSWSRYQETDKGISLCAAPLRKDSKSRSTATEDPTKVSCPYCVELMHPQACSQAAVPCSFCTGIITRPKSGGDVQDVKIIGIPLENASLAIRLVGVRPPHVMSEARNLSGAIKGSHYRRGNRTPASVGRQCWHTTATSARERSAGPMCRRCFAIAGSAHRPTSRAAT
jgi:hypothetical protein